MLYVCTPHVILTTTENLYFKERNGGSERFIDLPNVTLLVNLKLVSVSVHPMMDT